MTTKLGQVLTYLEGLLAINSHGSWVTWSYEIMSQIKNISTTTVPNNTKLGRVLIYIEGLLPKSLMALESRDHARSHVKSKTYLHYHHAYGHQAWQDDDAP